MKIKITENMIKGPSGNIVRLFKTPDGFITNGDWMIREEYVELPDSHPALEDLKKTSAEILIPFQAEYTDDPDFTALVSDCYMPIADQFDEYDNIRCTYATKAYPIIFMDIAKGEIAGCLMPALAPEEVKELKEAKSKQKLMLLLNNPEKYAEKFNLIPVEYKLEGRDEVCGLFVEANATDEFIKRQIKFAVKQNGGRWLGKFERHPEKKDKMLEMVKAQLAKSDIAKIQKETLERYGDYVNGIHS